MLAAMSKPIIAIVGRPNVGKSTLFNRILGRNFAIVEDLPGVPSECSDLNSAWSSLSTTSMTCNGASPR